MKKFSFYAAVLTGGFMLFISGCGKDAQKPAEDSTPFKIAIEEYCKSKNYGMAATSFESISVNGDKAVTVCGMQEAESTYNIKVIWQFDFEKKDGKWIAKGHAVK
jgi:hypothetical protein